MQAYVKVEGELQFNNDRRLSPSDGHYVAVSDFALDFIPLAFKKTLDWIVEIDFFHDVAR